MVSGHIHLMGQQLHFPRTENLPTALTIVSLLSPSTIPNETTEQVAAF